ncbi:hypothetical protein KC19_8G085900 [Ceratodon purpureus]|uniref:Uncharacterized protein n=1 Tax=Ceratodon purpureus TaxID=3225 RepID=A0A8T0GZ42_CERPU|nr:hypothetical protein KC19_8G085900 [Ceratodon purpureus]
MRYDMFPAHICLFCVILPCRSLLQTYGVSTRSIHFVWDVYMLSLQTLLEP